jgi:hypothetical protein
MIDMVLPVEVATTLKQSLTAQAREAFMTGA